MHMASGSPFLVTAITHLDFLQLAVNDLHQIYVPLSSTPVTSCGFYTKGNPGE